MSTTIFYERNRRIMKSVKTMDNKSLLSHGYNASLYLSFREDLFIFGYILQALEELDDSITTENINNLMASIHLLLLSGYHTYNLPMFYNRDRDNFTNKETLHRYCNESIAELIIIILSQNSIKRLLLCDINNKHKISLIREFTKYNNYRDINSTNRKELMNKKIKEEMYRVFRLCFLGYEALRGVTTSKSDMDEVEQLSKYFSELYILTYTDLHPPCDTVQSCSQQEEKFVENKNGAMEILLKRNYFNRSFQNILQFIERQFLCKIRDNMRRNTRGMI